MSRALALALVPVAAALLASCGFSVPDITSVPDHPTFDADVKPLLDDHCNACHSDPPARDAPHGFRLDVYGNVNGVQGAKRLAREIQGTVEGDQMPPSAAWGDGVGPNGKELIKRWVADGAPQ